MRPHIVALALLLALALAPLGAEPTYHVVAPGETIYGLSRTFKVPVEAILAANNISDASKIKAGQKLLIPAIHTVGKGETLYGIARLYSVSFDALLSANHLTAKSVIVPGQLLVLPAGAKAAAATAATPAAKPASTPAASVAPATPANPVKPVAGGPSAGSGGAAAAFPPLVKTSPKSVDPALVWPCKGEARYFEGKIDGIMILTERGTVSKAIAGGRVVSAGPYRGYGLVVFVETRTGHIYVYGGQREPHGEGGRHGQGRPGTGQGRL